jgi:hypothetical protein
MSSGKVTVDQLGRFSLNLHRLGIDRSSRLHKQIVALALYYHLAEMTTMHNAIAESYQTMEHCLSDIARVTEQPGETRKRNVSRKTH